jgi:hypothetical protein
VQVYMLVARQQVELDVRMQTGKIGEPWHQPVLGDGGARVQRQEPDSACSLISSTS